MHNELTEQQKKDQILGIRDDYTNLENWDISIARKLAASENIELTDDHIEVLGYLRRTYKKHGPIKRAHSLTQALATQFATKGGTKFLYTLFPDGPVSQGCKLAGIPAPNDSRDNSFGTIS